MKRRQIFIELTSLLDVILIMLFILLTQARTRTAQALDTAALAESSAAQLQTELTAAYDRESALKAAADAQEERADALQRQLWTENVVLDNSLVLTVSVTKSGDVRLEEAGEAPIPIVYDWEDDTYARNRLRALLLDKLKTTDREAVFLVFQYDRARVYHAEYEMIEGIIQEVKQEARQRDIPLSVLELDIYEA